MLGRPVAPLMFDVMVENEDSHVIGQVVRTSEQSVTVRLKSGQEQIFSPVELRHAEFDEKDQFVSNNMHLAISGPPTLIPHFQ